MNHDKNNPEKQGQISPELGARIVAWVSGEASAAEVAELERLVAGRPELAAFKRRIEEARGLIAEALAPDKETLRLPAERRAALLKALRVPEKAAEGARSNDPEVPTLEARRRKYRIERQVFFAIAACLTLAFILSMGIPSFQKVRQAKQSIQREKARAAIELAVSESKARKELAAPEDDAEVAEGNMRESRVAGAPSPSVAVEMPVLGYEAAAGKVSTVRQEKYGSRSLQDSRDEKPIVLSPFTAAEDEPKLGFKANSTLAGSRIRTNLQDVQASISGGLSAAASQFIQNTASQTLQNEGSSNFQSSLANSLGVQAQNQTPGVSAGAVNSASFGVENRGQVAAAPGSEPKEPTVLSPFLVDSAEDKGSYQPNSTLAGTRVRTDLKDVASSITVVTSQFLQDTDAKNAEDLLTFTPGNGLDQLNKHAAAAPGKLAIPFGTGGTGGPAPVASDGLKKTAAASEVTALGESSAAREPLSTFSLHVSDVSFRLAQAALARGEMPDPERIRPEEFYNAFDYGDPAPAMSEKISCRTEQAADPAMQQRNLVRIAMKVPTAGRGAAQPLYLTVLLDTSGSMEREDRAAAVHRAMEVLVSLLGRNDRLTLIGFARSPRLLAEQVPGDKAGMLLDIIAHTPAEGGTNMEEAIKLGGELARRQFAPSAQNRIVLLTDGATNLGDADPAHLAALVKTLRQQGIAFDACGVGTDGIDDNVLEALTRKGAGRYYILDTPEAADAGFARQLAGSLRPAADNVKVQVRFNPSRVGNYRLIGFEQHRLNKEDFRNDSVQAAELSGGEAAVALYEVEALPQGDGELGEVHVRFRDALTGEMVERSWTLAYDPSAPALDRATPTMQLAGVAALLAEKLQGGASGGAVKLAELAPVIGALRTHYAHDARVQQLIAMYEQVRRMRRE